MIPIVYSMPQTQTNLMDKIAIEDSPAMRLLQPETELERLFFKDARFLAGLEWGKPRFGHPEGKVLYHIREVLNNVDKVVAQLPAKNRKKIRQQLRIITFVHDTFKNKEQEILLATKNRKHHALIAREFLAEYIDDTVLLDIIELHDDAFYVWRDLYVYGREERSKARLARLYRRIGANIQLYYLFFKCDTETGDKVQAPMQWFEKTIKGIQVVKI